MVALFSVFRDWQERRQVLQDIRRRVAAESLLRGAAVEDKLSIAHSAVKRGDNVPALKIWTDMVNRYPVETKASQYAFDILLGLKRFDEAEVMMRQGEKDRPGDPRFLTGLVRIADVKRDWDNLFELSAALRKRFPRVPEGYSLPAEALRQLKRFAEAEALTVRAGRYVGHDVRCRLIQAEIACDRDDWKEALKRFQLVVNLFNHSLAYVGVARALSRLGREAEAEAFLLEQAERLSSEPAFPIELARLAQARGDTALAIERWSAIGSWYRNHLQPCSLAAGALQQLGELAKAERMLRLMLEVFPDERWAYSTLAALLSNQRRNAEAAEVQEAARQLFG